METSQKSRSCLIGLFAFLIPFLFGFPFFGFGAYEFYKTDRMVRSSVETEGIVVGNYYDAATDYMPEVKFTTEDGEMVRFTDKIGSYPPAFEVGETVSVLYDPVNVRDARINRWFRIWFVPVLFLTIGALPGLLGFGLFMGIQGISFLSRRARQKQGLG